MARKIRWLIVSSVILVLLTSVAVVFAQGGMVERLVTLILPSNADLPAGKYDVTVNLKDNQQITGIINVPEETTNQNQISETAVSGTTTQPAEIIPTSVIPVNASSTAGNSNITWIILAAAIPIVMMGIGLWIYFKIIQPRRQIAPYEKALELLRSKQYEQAKRELTNVVGKLPDSMRNQARFFVAFSKYQLGEKLVAQNELKDLHDEDSENIQVAYFLAYVYMQNQENDNAELILEVMEKNRHLDFRDAKKLLGIVKFRRALIALKDGRIDAAEDLFEKVQQLGDFADQIPADLRNRYIVLGTKALFEKDTAEARNHFKRILESNPGGKSEQSRSLLASANVGLALADWIDEKNDVEVEKLLVDAAQLLDPNSPVILPWDNKQSTESIAEKLEELEKAESSFQKDKNFNRFLRDIHFLRAMVVLRDWGKMPGKVAHNALEQKYKEILERLSCARSIDPEFSDVPLIAGLLMFYVHKPGEEERSDGIEMLRDAQAHGMRDPDTMEIINNRKRIQEANADAVDTYILLLDRYLKDTTVRQEIRSKLLKQLGRYQRIQAWEKSHDLSNIRSAEPTLAEMHNRTEILITRVDEILQKQKGTGDNKELLTLREQIGKDSQTLVNQAKKIEDDEAALMVKTGKELFKDE